MTTVAQLLAVLNQHYPPKLAESWDNVGLLVGDPASKISKILLATDVTAATLNQAIEIGADVLLTHHPLLFRPLTTLTTATPKAALAIKAIQNRVHLIAAHTNADSANPGVSDALAAAIELTETRPMVAQSRPGLNKIVTFVPPTHLEAVREALIEAGAGAVGDYDRCSFTTAGTGTFRPLRGANPFIGTANQRETVAETRLEMVFPRHQTEAIVAAHQGAHPYETPAFDLLELTDLPSDTGLGRIGDLPTPLTARELAAQLAQALPATATGVRVGGDLDRKLTRIALCGGAGDSLLDRARELSVDAYITSDLRHHPASDALDWPEAPVLIDIPHWAAESLWLPLAEAVLQRELPELNTTISTINTDPWQLIIH